MNKCESYLDGSRICKSGFPQQHPICRGKDHKCHSCGRGYNSVPMCMREEVPEHILVRVIAQTTRTSQ
jgi:hypothetical protein